MSKRSSLRKGWLSVFREYKFSLHKTAFHDAVTLRYGQDPARLPKNCIFGTMQVLNRIFIVLSKGCIQNSRFKSVMKLRLRLYYHLVLVLVNTGRAYIVTYILTAILNLSRREKPPHTNTHNILISNTLINSKQILINSIHKHAQHTYKLQTHTHRQHTNTCNTQCTHNKAVTAVLLLS